MTSVSLLEVRRLCVGQCDRHRFATDWNPRRRFLTDVYSGGRGGIERSGGASTEIRELSSQV